MSWFDASGIKNLAKSALKEAQKTIDKALDIKDDDRERPMAVEADSVDFFSSWGLKPEDEKEEKNETSAEEQPSDQQTSVWGSFTGSFFEPPKNQVKQIRSLEETHEDSVVARTHISGSSSAPENIARVLESTPEETSKEEEPRKRKNKEEITERRWSLREGVKEQKKTERSSESVEVLGDSSETITTDSIEISRSSSSSVMCLKVNQSESVEILPGSSLTSPSSVEILGDWKSDGSPYLSPTSEQQSSKHFEATRTGDEETEDISVYESPSEEAKTPSGFEVSQPARGFERETTELNVASSPRKECQDVDESEEVSLAEDSYTSVSETTVMTIFENRDQQDLIKSSLKLSESESQTLQSSDYSLSMSSDSFKDRPNILLSVEPSTSLRKVESKKGNDGETIKGPSVVEPADKGETNEAVAEQYLMSTDSSCEGTLIESSSEDNATTTAISTSAQSKVPEAPLTASSYVKCMLADAMSDKSEVSETGEKSVVEVVRENSPISSESRSDLVKIGSDQTSGHTSGDELETTTSSDIEIISRYSPNGDSSSTASRQSPAKVQFSRSSDLLTRTLKTRGHSRELSEISVGSDDANYEIDKLLKRIQEMTEILEARESKLIEVSRMNMELHEQNNGLKKQLDNAEKHFERNQDLSQITDEYTQRLSALESKFQQAIRERDTLRKTVEQLKQETASKMSSVDISTMNAEKDETIRELREEGEKLSKQQLQHSNIIKKLRIKEKDNDVVIKNQKDTLDELNLELDRLKRSLNAKEEVERSQIEAVHTLTAKTKKQEKEILSLQENLDMAINKMDAYKKSFEAAKTELSEMTGNLRMAKEELKKAVENAGQSCQLSAQVDDLKMKLRQAEENCIRKEECLKQENAQLLLRLEAAEARNEELSESASTATKPLLRQLEQLQANLSHKSNSFIKQERILSDKIIELQSKLESFVQSNQTLKEDNLALKRKVSSIESKLNAKKQECDKLTQINDELKGVNESLSEENKKYDETVKALEKSHSSQVTELKRTINALENKLAIEKAATDAEKRKNHAIVESQQQQQMLQQQQSVDDESRLSPFLSVERESVGSSDSIIWPAFNDPMFESSSGRFPNVYDSLRSGNTTSIIENLQAQLKQKEGEVQQLQWELSRRNTERDVLNGELSSLSQKVETLNAKIVEMEALNENLNDIQTKYDALLQMYGEKVEENQELRLDLQDIKEMYKSQIDQLLKRD